LITFKYFNIPPALPSELPTFVSLERILETANPIPSAFEDEIERTKDLKKEYDAFQKDMQEFISALPIKKTKKKTCNVKTVK